MPIAMNLSPEITRQRPSFARISQASYRPRKPIYHYQAAYQFGLSKSPSAAAYESISSAFATASALAFAVTGLLDMLNPTDEAAPLPGWD